MSRQPLLAVSLAVAALCSACGDGVSRETMGISESTAAATPDAMTDANAPPSAAEPPGSEASAASTSPSADTLTEPSADTLTTPTAGPLPDSRSPAGLRWFAGGIDEAFETARDEGKPVLLYWGAEWCPYCADLEAHVFSRGDVQRKLSLFVPVYLDGDGPGAQRWGDVFGVAGYPTVLALDPERAELARIAGGMELEVYVDMLDLVLGDVSPLDDLLAKTERGAISASDCRRLAFNGWGLETVPAERAPSLSAALESAAAACPPAMSAERARLTISAAAFAVDAAGQDTADDPALRRLVAAVRAIAADPALAARTSDALRRLDADYFAAARRLEPEHTQTLLESWTAAMDAAYADPRYGHGDRLAAVRSKVQAVDALAPDGIPPELAADGRRIADDVLEEIGVNAPGRRGAVNAAINLLVALDDIDRAYEIAERELERSRTPYYSMADLAWLDEQRGRTADAIAWLERAYHASKGRATRFQWGTNYVRGLLRMAPDDEAAIRAAALQVLGELDGPDRIYRRSRARLEALDASLREWGASGRGVETLDLLRRRMASTCEDIPPEETAALASCRSFLRDDHGNAGNARRQRPSA